MADNESGGRAAVLGGGTMGAGIAQVLLEAGCEVVIVEADAEAAERARSRVADGLGRRKNVAPEELEARTEKAIGPDTLLASNTSSLPISDLAEALERPERFCGMHFFNPVPLSALVEVVTGKQTGPEAVAEARAWVARLGLESIVVRDSPGFATSRLGVALGLEAIRMVEEEVATPEDIDTGMVLGYRHPMGPLRLTDLVGLDVRLAIAEHLAATLGPRFDPPALLREKVEAGELGKKAGRGFYSW